MRIKLFLRMAILTLMMTLCVSAQTKDYSLARAQKYNGKLAFFYNEPVEHYEVVFTFNNSISGIECMSPEQIINTSIVNSSVEAGFQNKLFDAIIIGNNRRDLAIKFTDNTKDNSIARVQKNNGKYVFVQCEPLEKYSIYKKIDVGGRKNKCTSVQQGVDVLIKKAKNSDAIMFGSTQYDQIINFINNGSDQPKKIYDLKVGDKIAFTNQFGKLLEGKILGVTGNKAIIEYTNSSGAIKKTEIGLQELTKLQ